MPSQESTTSTANPPSSAGGYAEASQTPHRQLSRPGRPGGKRDLRRRERTAALLKAGLDLFLQRGIEGVTIDDLVRTAGTAKGNFYRYFPDKTALVEALANRIGSKWLPAFEACKSHLANAQNGQEVFEAYAGLARDISSVAKDHPRTVRLYLQEARSPGVGARAPFVRLCNEINRLALELSETAVERKLVKVSSAKISGLAVVGATERLMLAALQGEIDVDATETWGVLVRVVLNGANSGALNSNSEN